MVLDPTNSPVDRIRLRIADFSDVPILTDSIIQYYLTKNNSNESMAAKECAFVILGELARGASYNKIDALIVDGRYAFKSYQEFLKMLISDPRTSLSIPMSYFGGISKEDMFANDTNPDNNTRPQFTTELTITNQYLNTAEFIA